MKESRKWDRNILFLGFWLFIDLYEIDFRGVSILLTQNYSNMKKWGVLFFMMFALVSCTNESSTNESQKTQINGYEIRSKSVFQDVNLPSFEQVTIGNLQNGKLYSETVENFSNGISQGSPITTQTHFYNGDLLISKIDNGFDRVRDFYYDASGRMVGAKMTLNISAINYYRFVYLTDNIIYFEKTLLPYNEAANTVLSRNIIEFDGNDNIIKAGRDANLDGIVENQNLFSYVNNNLASITKADGTVQNFDYSNVIDSFLVLNDKSYGKKNLRIIESEGYVNLGLQDRFQSKNILSQDLLDNTYDVLSSNFYKKKTVVRNNTEPVGQNIITTEFFFD